MIKDLLAIVETGPLCTGAVDAAVLLAEQECAHLGITAVTERLLLLAPFDPMGQCWPEEGREADHRAGLAAIRQQASVATVPVDVRGLCEEPALLPSIGDLQGRYADLVLIGAAPGWSDQALRRGVIDAVLLGAGAPVLLSPPGWMPARFDRIALGWNASQQSARAARELRQIARPGATIDILIVDAEAPSERREPGQDIARHLARHGFKTRVHMLSSQGQTTAGALQTFVRDEGAQLLAVGAYAHARFRTAVFGGVTKHMIEHPDVATLLVH